MVPFYPKYQVLYYDRDSKRDHSLDSHPYGRIPITRIPQKGPLSFLEALDPSPCKVLETPFGARASKEMYSSLCSLNPLRDIKSAFLRVIGVYGV